MCKCKWHTTIQTVWNLPVFPVFVALKIALEKSLLVLGVASCFVLPMIFVLLFSVSSIVDWISFCLFVKKKQRDKRNKLVTISHSKWFSYKKRGNTKTTNNFPSYVPELVLFYFIFFLIMFCYIWFEYIVTEIHMLV